jgi:hypothetical protein
MQHVNIFKNDGTVLGRANISNKETLQLEIYGVGKVEISLTTDNELLIEVDTLKTLIIKDARNIPVQLGRLSPSGSGLMFYKTV